MESPPRATVEPSGMLSTACSMLTRLSTLTTFPTSNRDCLPWSEPTSNGADDSQTCAEQVPQGKKLGY